MQVPAEGPRAPEQAPVALVDAARVPAFPTAFPGLPVVPNAAYEPFARPPPPAGCAVMGPPPPKPCGPSGPAATLLSGSMNSSQQDTLTRSLVFPESGGEEKDEYLMKLLRKGTAPPAAPAQRPPLPPLPVFSAPLLPLGMPLQLQGPPALALQQVAMQEGAGQVFRAPGPVRRPLPPSAAEPASLSPARRLPRQTSTSLASPSSLAAGATVPSLGAFLLASAPSAGTTAADHAVPSVHGSGSGSGAAAALPSTAVPAAAAAADDENGTSFTATRRRLGDEMAYTVRNTMIRQQVMFLEQVFDLHRAIAIQRLLMQNCPEVQQVMGEAMRLMSSVGSQHGSGSGRGSKLQRTTPNGGGATVPGSGGSDDPSSFRPDSQFAAVPQLPGEAQTAGASGDEDDGGSGDANGSGSGQNGSGGGSTSPQPGGRGAFLGPPPAALPYMYLAHTVMPTPSGASAAPNAAWPWGMHAAAALGQQQVQQQAPAAHGLPPVPQGPPQMPPWVGQDAGLAAVGINTHPPPAHTSPAGTKATAPAPTAGGNAKAPAKVLPAAPAAPPAQPPAAAGAAAAAAALAAQPVAPLVTPAMPPPMPYAHMMAGLAGSSGPSSMTAGLPFVASTDPLSWWYRNYYGAAAASYHQQAAQAQQMAGMPGMSLATAQAAAAAAVALMPQLPGAAGCNTAGHGLTGAGGTAGATATNWWQDPQLTFGPTVDPDVVARRAAARAGLGREGPEVQSAPVGTQLGLAGRSADARQRRGGMFASDSAPPPRMPRPLKRKAAADADEASSGTTGHEYEPAGTQGGSFKRGRSSRPVRSDAEAGAAAAAAAFGGGAQDENAAELLLAIRKQ